MTLRVRSALACLFALPMLSSCSQSEYDACYDEAVDEVRDRQQDYIDAGGENSIKGYYMEQETYAVAKCRGLPDD